MSKQGKSYLKDARNAIKSKEYGLAIKLCKEIIAADPSMYMAYILLGASYQETDKKEAAKQLWVASSLSSEPTLAFQGLANCVEPNELPEVLDKLLSLTPYNYKELHKKLLSIALTNSKEVLNSCLDVLKKESELEAKDNYLERIRSANYSIAEIYKIKKNLISENYLPLIEHSLTKLLIENNNSKDDFELSECYLFILIKATKINEAIKFASLISVKYPTENSPKEILCTLFGSHYKNSIFHDIDMSRNADDVLSLNINSVVGLTAKAICFYGSNDLISAKKYLERVQTMMPSNEPSLAIILDIYMKTASYIQVEHILETRKDISKDQQIIYAKSLVLQNNKNKIDKAIKLCRSLLLIVEGNEQIELIYYLSRALLVNNEYDSAEKAIEKLKSIGRTAHVILLLSLKFRMQQLHQEAIQILESNPLYSSAYYVELGINYYCLGMALRSLESFLNAAKLEPFNSECFYWLGKIYLHNDDETRAKLCFEKSLKINIQNRDAVMCLNTIYRHCNDFKTNQVLLQELVNECPDTDKGWALRQLAINQLAIMDYNKAIDAFRLALRYSSDSSCWEGLADAYFSRGSYNSAMKVYQKAIELNPGNIYPKLQIAHINLKLMMYNEALICFIEILNQNATYFPALKGIAETYFGLTCKFLKQQVLGRSIENARKSVQYTIQSLIIKPNMIYLWRLLANVLLLLATNSKSDTPVTVSGSLIGSEDNQVTIKGDLLLELASKCYNRALVINKTEPLLWYELSRCFYNRANILCAKNYPAKEMFQMALAAVKNSIKLNYNSWKSWNLLGIISATKEINNLQLAQHCFIKAVTIDKKSYTSWTNLGILYLLEGELILANKAFSIAQQSDPNYVNAWAGQSAIAEIMDEKEEALDLFRHCTNLGFHPESTIGYAHWVSLILKDSEKMQQPKYKYAIENMHAVATALDAITWFCKNDDEMGIEALCYMGFLNYENGLYLTAANAFSKAAEKVDGEKRDLLLCNLGFSLLKVKNYTDAIKAFNSITEASYKSSIGLAFSYFKAAQYEDAYSVYDSALQWLATSEIEKSMILIAISSIVYAFQGPSDAKTVIFQCISLSSPPIEGLFSACALGILHKDTQLSELVLQELSKYDRNYNARHHIVFLTSQIKLMNESKSAAYKYILSQIHILPDNPHLRQILSTFLLINYSTSERYAKSVYQIALSSIKLYIKNIKNSTSLDVSKSLTIASQAMKPYNRDDTKKMAQRAVHINPSCKEAWSALISCR